jgi:hypothetical protein
MHVGVSINLPFTRIASSVCGPIRKCARDDRQENSDFEPKYDDMVEYLRMTNHPEDADTVQDVKDKLVEFKNSGEEVRSSDFPMLYSS